MRHARPVLCESLSATARIATGGRSGDANHGHFAPGRTYHQLARHYGLKILKLDARDRSPANDSAQRKGGSPGSPYPNSLAFVFVKTTYGTPARGAANGPSQTVEAASPLTIH